MKVVSILKSTTKSLVAGASLSYIAWKSGSPIFIDFLKSGNAVTIALGLFTINTATLSVILTKLRDIVDNANRDLPDDDKISPGSVFAGLREQMLLCIREQMLLIILLCILMTIAKMPMFKAGSIALFTLDTLITSTFAYNIFILYDSSKSIICLIDID